MNGWRPVGGVFVVASVIVAGCNNRPNALRLEVAPVQESFKVGEPVRLSATFTSTDGTVCITRPRADAFRVELTTADAETEERFLPISNDQRVITRILEQVFFPINFGWLYLDMADLGGRFALVSQDQRFPCFLALLGAEGGIEVRDDDGEPPGRWKHSGSTLPPGRYRVDLRFRSAHSEYSPPPLFWRVYDQPVKASAEFTVIPDERAGG